MWPKTFTTKHIVTLWLAKDPQANKDYQAGAEGKVQMSFWARLSSLLRSYTARPSEKSPEMANL